RCPPTHLLPICPSATRPIPRVTAGAGRTGIPRPGPARLRPWTPRAAGTVRRRMTVRPPLAEQLDLQAHPEGGWYRETWRSPVSFRPPGYTGPGRRRDGRLLPAAPGRALALARGAFGRIVAVARRRP